MVFIDALGRHAGRREFLLLDMIYRFAACNLDRQGRFNLR
jgi:hypothetical protein